MAHRTTMDGNEACATVAYAANEVVAIYPITPASPMGELADDWAARGKPNIFGTVPRIVEMQSEGGAAGAVHGALQAGALTTTFTASQGLLLMLPNMFKIAGELTSAVIHVAARTVATHALSIFGDHSDIMAARTTGWAVLVSASVQEAHDLALVAQAATLRSRVPFLHAFDGFRTSHEVATIEPLTVEDIATLVDADLVREHRRRGLDPSRPVLRGSAQNPDVFFQAREAVNPYYDAVPSIVERAMAALRERTGRSYAPFDYVGDPRAERVLVLMGSGLGAAEEAVEQINADGGRTGLVKVRLYRPFSAERLVRTLPSSVRSIAVLDRTKEPGAAGEPLYQDVVTALAEQWRAIQGGGSDTLPRVIGGRYGLSSKEFTPAMAAAVLRELNAETPRLHFTVGIIDDVTHASLDWDPDFRTPRPDETHAVFYGLGSDGTVGSSKATVKIIGEHTDLHAQGYFVYDSKKSGAVTVSHLRFGRRPIRSTYLVERAGLVACHQFSLLDRLPVLDLADEGAVFLLNSPHGPDEVWDHLPREVQQTIIDRRLHVHVIDAHRLAEEAGLGGRINTVMQPCFFALSGVLPRDEAVGHIKASIERLYGRRGETVVRRNLEVVDRALAALHEVAVPTTADGSRRMRPPVPETAPDFVQRVTAMMIAGRGDLLPVSALPVDGTFPVGTARYERRGLAREIPIWDPEVCIDCGLCALVCPHAAIRTKVHDGATANGLPSKPWTGRAPEGGQLTIQVAPDDCTGCGVCVAICPAHRKESVKHKAINMRGRDEHLDRERSRFDAFLDLAEIRRQDVRLDTVAGCQLLEPLFEFSGACSGCGETPYLKLLTQLFGDRLLVANATGCSSIYGGNLPTTPWSCTREGLGPAWSNSLFEDNAEFGLGMRLALDQKRATAEHLLKQMALPGIDLDTLLDAEQHTETQRAEQTERLRALHEAVRGIDTPETRALLEVVEVLLRRSVWIVGGDGWAYDIGFGGLDHVLAVGEDVNVLVLDTEVYSNTGGQASKSTHRAAVAKFAAGGKPVRKKDLGLLAMGYGNVYVAQIAMGANPKQTIKAFLEAESYPGPSLIIAYSPCIAHGIDLGDSIEHEKQAVTCGYWPLYRYDPRHAHVGEHPLKMDSRPPKRPFREFAIGQARFAMLTRSNPEQAEHLFELAQKDIDERWHLYEQMVGIERLVPDLELDEEVS